MGKSQKEPGQSLAEISRQLRQVLPSEVKLISPCLWLVLGKVEVELNYHCRFMTDKEKQKKLRECFPYSISVRLNPSQQADEELKKTTGIAHYTRINWSGVFRSRTVSKRNDGSLNVESVATAVTKALEAFESHVVSLKKRKEDEARSSALIEQEVVRLTDSFKGIRRRLPSKLIRRGYIEIGKITLSVHLESADSGFTYSFYGSNLTAEEAESILKAYPNPEQIVVDGNYCHVKR